MIMASNRPVHKTRTVDIDYAAMASGKSSPGKDKDKDREVDKLIKHRRKASTPKKLNEGGGSKPRGKVKQGKSTFLNSTNGRWSVTPSPHVNLTPSRMRLDKQGLLGDSPLVHVNHDDLFQHTVTEDGEIVNLHANDHNKFSDEGDSEAVTSLEAEITAMKKKLEAKKVKSLMKKKELLQKQLDADDSMLEGDAEMEPPVKEAHNSKKRKSSTKGKRHDSVNDNDWEGLMSASSVSDKLTNTNIFGDHGRLPPFDKVQAMFADNPGIKKEESSEV